MRKTKAMNAACGESIARRLRRLSREMDEMGIVLFGGSGSGSLGLTTAAVKAD
jgi:hypothetical protein